jgi:hypothetical protein
VGLGLVVRHRANIIVAVEDYASRSVVLMQKYPDSDDIALAHRAAPFMNDEAVHERGHAAVG